MTDVEAIFPEFRGRRIVAIERGWDFHVFDVDDEWIVRIPRRTEVEAWLVREVALLAELGPTLPLPVADIELDRGTHGVAYRKLPGRRFTRDDAGSEVAHDLGVFLSALHAFPVARALKLGVEDRSGERMREHYGDERWPEFRERVLPLLAADERADAERRVEAFLDDKANVSFRPAVVHRDLGPEHVLVDRARVGGVIADADAGVGDPAIDFAWALNGLGKDFAAELLHAYAGDVDAGFRGRARVYHLLGPFYEVVFGLDNKLPEHVARGLVGIRRRLERWPSSA